MKLFAVFIGGGHPRANIELHDMRFVVGESLEATIPQLRAAWWGKPGSLHIDGYAELTYVDGWRVDVRPGPAPQGSRRALWFVNVGGYSPAMFGEQHHYLFMAGEERAKVWSRARGLSPDWLGRHKDNFVAVDDVIDVNRLLGEMWHLDLEQAAAPGASPRIVSAYFKL